MGIRDALQYEQVLKTQARVREEGFSPFTFFERQNEIHDVYRNFFLAQFSDEAKKSVAERKWTATLPSKPGKRHKRQFTKINPILSFFGLTR